MGKYIKNEATQKVVLLWKTEIPRDFEATGSLVGHGGMVEIKSKCADTG